jgi:hypothetical protein
MALSRDISCCFFGDTGDAYNIPAVENWLTEWDVKVG